MATVEQLFPQIAARLNNHPAIRLSFENGIITVPSSGPNGFAVSLENGEHDEVTICFANWHYHFSDPAEIVAWFAFGLSTKCRLQVKKRGETEYFWTVQWEDNGTWRARLITALFLFPFWRKKEITYLQNNYLNDIDVGVIPEQYLGEVRAPR